MLGDHSFWFNIYQIVLIKRKDVDFKNRSMLTIRNVIVLGGFNLCSFLPEKLLIDRY